LTVRDLSNNNSFRSKTFSLFETLADSEEELTPCRSRHAVSTNLHDKLLRSSVTVYFNRLWTDSWYRIDPPVEGGNFSRRETAAIYREIGRLVVNQ